MQKLFSSTLLAGKYFISKQILVKLMFSSPYETASSIFPNKCSMKSYESQSLVCLICNFNYFTELLINYISV